MYATSVLDPSHFRLQHEQTLADVDSATTNREGNNQLQFKNNVESFTFFIVLFLLVIICKGKFY